MQTRWHHVKCMIQSNIAFFVLPQVCPIHACWPIYEMTRWLHPDWLEQFLLLKLCKPYEKCLVIPSIGLWIRSCCIGECFQRFSLFHQCSSDYGVSHSHEYYWKNVETRKKYRPFVNVIKTLRFYMHTSMVIPTAVTKPMMYAKPQMIFILCWLNSLKESFNGWTIAR